MVAVAAVKACFASAGGQGVPSGTYRQLQALAAGENRVGIITSKEFVSDGMEVRAL